MRGTPRARSPPSDLSCLLWGWTQAASSSKARAGSDTVHVPTDSTRRYSIRSAPAEHGPSSAFSWRGCQELACFPSPRSQLRPGAAQKGEVCPSPCGQLADPGPDPDSASPSNPLGSTDPGVTNTLTDVSVTLAGKYPHTSLLNTYELMLRLESPVPRGCDRGGGGEVQPAPHKASHG